MRKIIAVAAAALTLGTATITTTAADAREWRRHEWSGRHFDGGRHYSRGYYGPRYGYRHHHGWRERDGALAAGIIGGLATGALIGGAARNGPPCTRYRSYDPGSGTYIGRNGVRYSCP